MSGQTGDQQDKTEAPTARRLQKAQEEGGARVSREVVLLAGLAAMTLTFLLLDRGIGLNLTRSLRAILDQPDPRLLRVGPFVHAILATTAVAIAPFALPVALAAIAATFLQTRFAMRSRALRVDLGRLSPRRGLKQMF